MPTITPLACGHSVCIECVSTRPSLLESAHGKCLLRADSELATTLGRLGRVAGGIARGFLARFAHIFARQVLNAAFRVLARILFRR